MGMVRSVAGDFQACFWAEGHGRICRLCLNADLIMDAERRRELLAMAKSGKNARARTFMGKIRDMLESCMCSYEEAEQEELAAGIVMPFGEMGCMDPMAFGAGFAGDVWSMQKMQSMQGTVIVFMTVCAYSRVSRASSTKVSFLNFRFVLEVCIKYASVGLLALPKLFFCVCRKLCWIAYLFRL